MIQKPSYKLFVDMDGVLTNFDQQFFSFFGVPMEVKLCHDDLNVKAIIDRFLPDAPEEYWADMPWLDDAKAAWPKLIPTNPTILSAPHFAPACKPGKYRWCESQLGPRVPVILDRDKARHSDEVSILIDDTEANRIGWKGIFILHESWQKTEEALETLGLFDFSLER